MFTGIIKSVAKVKNYEYKNGSLFLTIATPPKWRLKAGDSIATDGACLTVTKIGNGFYQTELMPESLSRTSFGKRVPKKLNLERPLRPKDFLDGHIVQGHVDVAGKITEFKVKSNKSKVATSVCVINFPRKYSCFVVEKGSIAIDGVSLTVVKVGKNWLSVALIPHTLNNTTIGTKQVGDLVNLEFDILAKYICKKR